MADRQDNIDVILQERPYVAQAIQTQILNDIAGILYKQLTLTEDSVADIVRKYTFNITNSILELNSDKLPSLPWISMTVYNDGISPVHVYINEFGVESVVSDIPNPTDPPMNPGESFQIDFRGSNINKVFFQCDPGNTATIRIVASMKKYRSTTGTSGYVLYAR